MRTLYGTFLAAALLLPGSLPAQSKIAAMALDDSVIVGIFDAANAWDIATGSLAATRAARKDVKDFGALLAHDHKVVLDSVRKLAAKLNTAPVPVRADFPLKVGHEAAMKKLSALSGPAFDKAFLEH